jgi:tripartite-type tricarboxylate transporter receptor subunit TctC
MNRREFVRIAAGSALAASGLKARAHEWPTRPVRILVPFPTGLGIDIAARVLGERLAASWRQPVVVENRPGAGGNVGAEAAARSAPDGYTIYMASFGHGVAKFLYPSLPFDAVADFAPVTLVSVQPCVMVVPNSSPARTVAEFIAYARANKGKVTYGSVGNGTAPHLAGELFKQMADVEMTHVPYRTPPLPDLVAGRLDVVFSVTGAALPLLKAGKLRALAVTGTERIAAAPHVPRLSETGLNGFNVSSWFGFYVPARTPTEVIRRINADTIDALAAPGVGEKFDELALTRVGSTPEELARHLQQEMGRWGPLIVSRKITLDS